MEHTERGGGGLARARPWGLSSYTPWTRTRPGLIALEDFVFVSCLD